MSNFIYALEAVTPILLYLVIGQYLKKTIITPSAIPEIDRLVSKVLVPMLVFRSVYKSRESLITHLKTVGYSWVILAIFLAVGLTVLPRLLKDKRQVPTMLFCVCRGNFTLYGLPFAEMLGGAEAAGIAASVVAATVPLQNVLTIALFVGFTGGKKLSKKQILKTIFKNPVVLAVLLGYVFCVPDWYLPTVGETVVNALASACTPIAFLVLGAKLCPPRDPGRLKALVLGITWKLFVMPILFLPVGICLLHLNSAETVVIFLFLATPSALTTYQLSLQYDAFSDLAGDMVVYSTVVSTVSICIWIFILRSLGLFV